MEALQATDEGAGARVATTKQEAETEAAPTQRHYPEALSVQLLQELTQGFSPSCAVGEGGFATVYRAELPPEVCPGAPWRLAAIKRGQPADSAVDSR